MNRSETVFTQLTPEGRSAIATLVVAGRQAMAVVEQHFRPLSKMALADYPLQRIIFGKWLHQNGTFEELVIARTDVATFEIHCHGGVSAVAAVAESLEDAGVIRRSWQQWELSQTEATAAAEVPYWKRAEMLLPQTTTALATKLVMQHANGEIEKLLFEIHKLKAAGKYTEVSSLVSPYRHASQLGRHLIEPWKVVIAGKPNAGKSSLLNQWVGYDRAIVNQQAGTTRDLLRAQTVVHGWPIEFVDTAGLRQGDDAIEVAGIERAQEELLSADLVIWLHDLTTGLEIPEIQLLTQQTVLVVGNKSDLARENSLWSHPRISAETGEGINSVLDQVLETLVPGFVQQDYKVLFCDQMEETLRQLDS